MSTAKEREDQVARFRKLYPHAPYPLSPVEHYQDQAKIALFPELVAALQGLFEHCAMVHKHWGEGCNSKQADDAQKAARAALAKVPS